MNDFFHGGEVSGPQKLGLLAQGENPRGEHFSEGSQDLQREPLISNDGCLGPVDDLGERQLPAGAEENRDAAGLGGRAVTGEPSPRTYSPPPRPQQPPLQGLEEAGGGRAVAGDDAEGGIGECLSWVGLLGSRVLLTVSVPGAG